MGPYKATDEDRLRMDLAFEIGMDIFHFHGEVDHDDIEAVRERMGMIAAGVDAVMAGKAAVVRDTPP